jgi:hypothetical protein
MSNAALAPLAVLPAGLAILLVILYRQRQVRVLSTSFALPLALVGAGVADLVWASPTPLTPTAVRVLGVLLALDAVGLGAIRASTVRVWHDGACWLRQGTWLTIGLWLVGVLIHVSVDAVAHLGPSNALLYLGVTYGAQTVVLRRRLATSRTSVAAAHSVAPDPRAVRA